MQSLARRLDEEIQAVQKRPEIGQIVADSSKRFGDGNEQLETITWLLKLLGEKPAPRSGVANSVKSLH